MALANIHDAVRSVIDSSEVDEATSDALDGIFSPTGDHAKLFNGLETSYIQMKYYRHAFNLVVSC